MTETGCSILEIDIYKPLSAFCRKEFRKDLPVGNKNSNSSVKCNKTHGNVGRFEKIY